MIKTINGWRAVFALIIVLFHVGVAGLEELTWAGVTFFFMASGMLLSMKYPFKSLDVNSYKRFAWRHAVKLYPLHWLVLALWLLVMALAGALVIKPLALALNALLLQSWSLVHSIYYSYNHFSWFLSTLLFCYLCYPLLARWYMPLRLRYRLIILAVLAVVVFGILAATGGDDYNRTALYVFPPMRLVDFLLGMTLVDLVGYCRKWRWMGRGESGTDADLVAVALLSATVMGCQAYDFMLPWGDTMMWWIPVAVILLVAVLYNKREGFIGKLLSSKPLQWLGNISFEIFILQGLALLLYNYLLAPVMAHIGLLDLANEVGNDLFGIGGNRLLAIIFVLPIDILLAWAVNRLFTRPLAKRLA